MSIIPKIQTLFCENKLKTIFRQYEYLDTWYSRNFIYQSLINNTLIFREKIAENGYYIIKMADKTANKYKNNSPVIAFDLYLYWIANVFIMNQIEKTKELVQIVNFHLDTNLLKETTSTNQKTDKMARKNLMATSLKPIRLSMPKIGINSLLREKVIGQKDDENKC